MRQTSYRRRRMLSCETKTEERYILSVDNGGAQRFYDEASKRYHNRLKMVNNRE